MQLNLKFLLEACLSFLLAYKKKILICVKINLMKKIAIPILFLFCLSTIGCRKDCSNSSLTNWSQNISIKKNSTSIVIHNKYIYPIHIIEITCGLKSGKAYTISNDVKILSGLSHTYKYSDFNLPNGTNENDLELLTGKYTRDMCDYKDRSTPYSNFSGEYFGIRF